MELTKSNLIAILSEISNLEPNRFKSMAYIRAISTIQQLDWTEISERTSFLDLPGIGTSINAKILEFKETGNIAKLAELLKDSVGYLDPELYKIRKSFITKRVSIDSPELAELKNTIIGFYEYFDDVKVTFAGSYRRRKPLIADLDIICWDIESKKFIEEKLQKYYKFSCLVYGETKSSWKYDSPSNLTVDLNLGDLSCAPFQLLHHTGSARHNIIMRARAKEMGYTLNQYGLFPNPDCSEDGKARLESTEFKTEEDVFKFLGMNYVEPKFRLLIIFI